ncbi:cation transporter [Aestuariimicrobium sp. p3-SID1156]|uniref:heavy-metal-associated domain-containing protein n=1 Tax=Aestuariimicrobium sp. p3-SID1156 TaxID=2916038 RepID=UPI00223BA58E|nr:cation transporter [Aestuariimicrobium sp. p3-SID1156]MCT1459785.1 cation transporter [Aestuariimicrobium sp. p3-SID1156]
MNTTTTTHTTLRAQGFSCPSCVSKIEKALMRIEGVQKAEVKFASARIEVDHDDRVSVQALVEAVRRVGYESTPAAF